MVNFNSKSKIIMTLNNNALGMTPGQYHWLKLRSCCYYKYHTVHSGFNKTTLNSLAKSMFIVLERKTKD